MSNTQNTTSKKYGRTLLLKPVNNFDLTNDDFVKLTGVVSNNMTKTTGSYFLTFDTSANAQSAYNLVKSDYPNVLVKYSYYKVFFTINGLQDNADYNSVKDEFVKYLETTSGSSVLFFKLYKKGSSFIGCGDFTLDTLDGMNSLLNRDTGVKNFSLSSNLTGTFHRFNSYKSKNTNTQV
jgi:hypothetical protein